MTNWLDNRAVNLSLLGLALLPALLYAYSGTFSRMLGDDYIYLQIARDLGPLHGALHWRNNWAGHYSSAFLHGLMTPFAMQAPALLPGMISACWLFGLAGLFGHLLARLDVRAHRRSLALILAGLTVAASIHAIYTVMGLYFFISATQYTLPIALLTLWFALLLTACKRLRSRLGLALAGLLLAAFSFISAGFAEMTLVVQLAFITLLSGLLLIGFRRRLPSRVIGLLGAGWLGTLASLALQWSAPGRLKRTETIWEYPQFHPKRDLAELTRLGLRDLHEMTADPEVAAGFLLLFALALLLSLGARSVKLPASRANSPLLTQDRVWHGAGLLVQLLILPAIWLHQSDQAIFLGRFSASYMVAVSVNGALLLGFLWLLWRHTRLQAWLNGGARRPPVFALGLLAGGLTLFALPILRDMHITAQNLFFVSALSLLALAWREWASANLDHAERWLLPLPLAGTALVLLSVAALVTLPRYFVGVGAARHWSAAAFGFVSLGLVWGFTLGRSLTSLGELARRRLRWTCFLALAVVYLSIVSSQLSQLPNFMTMARDWDARHALLIAAADRGEAHAIVPPISFNQGIFLTYGEIAPEARASYDGAMLDFYGLESITVAAD